MKTEGQLKEIYQRIGERFPGSRLASYCKDSKVYDLDIDLVKRELKSLSVGKGSTDKTYIDEQSKKDALAFLEELGD